MMKIRRVAVCLITDNYDNILMGKRNDSKKFCCPAGRANKKEDIHLTAVRELKEETGLDVIDIKLVKVEYNSKKGIMLYLFKITVDPDQKIDMSNDPDEEFSELKYVDPNEVIDQLSVPINDNICLKYWANH